MPDVARADRRGRRSAKTSSLRITEADGDPIKQRARQHLLSLSDSIDTRTASGRLVLHVLGAVGQWEREATAERTRDALAQLRADGVRLGAEPLGWRRTEALDETGRRRCEEAGEEQETIRRVRELRRQGLVIKEIIATLEAEGR